MPDFRNGLIWQQQGGTDSRSYSNSVDYLRRMLSGIGRGDGYTMNDLIYRDEKFLPSGYYPDSDTLLRRFGPPGLGSSMERGAFNTTDPGSINYYYNERELSDLIERAKLEYDRQRRIAENLNLNSQLNVSDPEAELRAKMRQSAPNPKSNPYTW